MSSVTSTSSGITALIQALSSSGSLSGDASLSSTLSSPAVQSALQKSPGDLVELSQQAVELQVANGLFGNSNTSGTASPESLLLQALTGSQVDRTASAIPSLEQAQALFGTNSTVSFLG